MRRHHNTKGERQIRRGKTAISLARICRKLGLPRPRTDRPLTTAQSVPSPLVANRPEGVSDCPDADLSTLAETPAILGNLGSGGQT